MKRFFQYLFFILLLASCTKDPVDDLGIGISLEPTALTLRVGETATLSATVTPADLMNKTVLWTSDNTDVAKVRSGVVTALAPGTATITAKTDRDGKTAQCKVTVLSPVLVRTIQLEGSRLAVDIQAGSQEIPFTVVPDNATNKTLLWESSDETVITVSGGILTAHSKGTATVTVSATDGSGVTSSCEVTVLNIPAAVDLGLSVKWASFNLGAESPGGYGDYYAWGEIATKENYSWSTYAYGSSSSGPFSKYGDSDKKTVLDPADDIARFLLCGNWRIPVEAEMLELMDEENCSWTMTTLNGIQGYSVTSLKNGSSIFLPFTGYMENERLSDVGTVGNYWSSTRTAEQMNAFGMGFSSTIVCENYVPRFLGLSIRPVCE